MFGEICFIVGLILLFIVSKMIGTGLVYINMAIDLSEINTARTVLCILFVVGICDFVFLAVYGLR